MFLLRSSEEPAAAAAPLLTGISVEGYMGLVSVGRGAFPAPGAGAAAARGAPALRLRHRAPPSVSPAITARTIPATAPGPSSEPWLPMADAPAPRLSTPPPLARGRGLAEAEAEGYAPSAGGSAARAREDIVTLRGTPRGIKAWESCAIVEFPSREACRAVMPAAAAVAVSAPAQASRATT